MRKRRKNKKESTVRYYNNDAAIFLAKVRNQRAAEKELDEMNKSFEVDDEAARFEYAISKDE